MRATRHRSAPLASWRWRLATIAAVLALVMPAGSASANVGNQGGGAIPNPALYIVFWGSEWTYGSNQFPQYPQYITYLTDFFSNLGGTPWLGTVTQYGAQNPSGQLLGTWIDDSTEPPSIPSWNDIDGEARATLLHFLGGFFGLSPNDGTIPLNTIVLVALPSGHDPADFGTVNCAWHSSDSKFTAAGTTWPFAFIELPWQPDNNCAQSGEALGPVDSYGHNTLDGVSYSAGHEYAEAITDPFLNGWYDPAKIAKDGTNEGEIGDLCNGITSATVAGAVGYITTMDSVLVGTQPNQYYGVTKLWSNQANGGAGGPELQCQLNAAPTAQWSTTSLNFGLAKLGDAGVTRTATLQNTGNAELVIATLGCANDPYPCAPVFVDPTIGAFSQDFQIEAGTDSCLTNRSTLPGVTGLGAVLFPQPTPNFQQCTVSVTFTPSTGGPETAVLKVDSNDPNAPGGQTILTLSGTGVPANVRFTQGHVNFGATVSTLVGGVEGSRQLVGLTNGDTVPHSLGEIGFAGTDPADFSALSNGCSGLTLLPGQTCELTLLFRPQQTGTRDGILQVVDSTAGSVHEVSLVGSGLGPILNVRSGPDLSTPTVALNFGDVRAGTLSAPQFLALTNTGQADLTIQTITATGDFRVLRTTCPRAPSALPINGSCEVEVALAAVHAPVETGTLTISANANNSPRRIFLSGEVVAPAAQFSAKSLSFTSFSSFSSSPQQVQLINTGTAPLAVSSITTSGPFRQTNSCPVASTTGLGSPPCTITVIYTPTACGMQSGSLTVTDDALPSGTQTLPLSGVAACTLPLGSFVIGDGNAALGGTVTFWGSRWSTANQLSGGPAPASFKGYADTLQTNPPACGHPWAADPADNTRPPATLPTYIAVIVAKHITGNGSSISGQHIAHLAIVQVNAGYAPDPGHAGTGTIVGLIC